MFYNLDILSRRRHGFGIYWLAATLGPRSGVAYKKLTRKEVMACNLVVACDKLATTDQPLALRLQSNLLCGIARVYQQQWSIYSSEVTQMHQNLRRALANPPKRDTISIDLQPPAAATAHSNIARGQITLGLDPALAVLGWDPEYDQMYDWSEPMEVDRLEQESSKILSSRFAGTNERSSSGQIGLQSAPHHVRDVSKITLQEPHLEDYRMGNGAGLNLEEGLGTDFEFGEGELGLLEGQFPELDDQIRAGSNRPSLQGGFQSSSSVGGLLPEGLDMGGMEPDFQPDFGGEGYYLPQDLPIDDQMPGVEKIPSPQPESPLGPLDPQVDQEIMQAVAARSARRGSKKFKRGLIDNLTALEDDEIQEMRRSYVDRMTKARLKSVELKREQEQARAGLDAIFAPPEGFVGGPLAEFWKEKVTDQLVPIGGGAAEVERQARAAASSPAPVKAARDALAQPGGARASSVELGRPLHRGVSPMFELEFGGEGYNAQGQDMGGLEIVQDPYEFEVGRAISRPASVVPWHAEDVTSDIGAIGFEPARSDREVSVQGQVSLDTPIKARGRTASLLGRSRATSIAEQKQVEDPESKLTSSQSQPSRALKIDSQKFLAYAHRLKPSLPEGEELTFSHLLPVATTSSSVAAIGLYHVLVLATRNDISVKQEAPYGEIIIEL